MTNEYLAFGGTALVNLALEGDSGATTELKRRLKNAMKSGKAHKVKRLTGLLARLDVNTEESTEIPAEAPAPANEEPTVIQTSQAATEANPIDYLRAAIVALAERVGSRDKAIVDIYENVDKREAVGKVIGMKITQAAIAEAVSLHPQRIAQILKAHREAIAAPAHVVDMDALKAALLG